MLTAPLDPRPAPSIEVEDDLAQQLLNALEEARQAGVCPPDLSAEDAVREAVGRFVKLTLAHRSLTRRHM